MITALRRCSVCVELVIGTRLTCVVANATSVYRPIFSSILRLTRHGAGGRTVPLPYHKKMGLYHRPTYTTVKPYGTCTALRRFTTHRRPPPFTDLPRSALHVCSFSYRVGVGVGAGVGVRVRIIGFGLGFGLGLGFGHLLGLHRERVAKPVTGPKARTSTRGTRGGRKLPNPSAYTKQGLAGEASLAHYLLCASCWRDRTTSSAHSHAACRCLAPAPEGESGPTRWPCPTERSRRVRRQTLRHG